MPRRCHDNHNVCVWCHRQESSRTWPTENKTKPLCSVLLIALFFFCFFFLLSCRTYIVNYWWRFLRKVRQPQRQLALPLLSTSHDVAAAASYFFIVSYLLLQPLVPPRRFSLFFTSFCLHFLTPSLHMFPNHLLVPLLCLLALQLSLSSSLSSSGSSCSSCSSHGITLSFVNLFFSSAFNYYSLTVMSGISQCNFEWIFFYLFHYFRVLSSGNANNSHLLECTIVVTNLHVLIISPKKPFFKLITKLQPFCQHAGF